MSNTATRTMPATQQYEAYYEVPWVKKGKDRVDRGTFNIYDADDEAWEGKLMQPPYNGDPQGYLNVALVTRVDGEVVKQVAKKGKCCHMNVARHFIREFNQRRSEGDPAPWDQYRNVRDAVDAAKAAKTDGDATAMEEMRDLFRSLMAPVSGGSK